MRLNKRDGKTKPSSDSQRIESLEKNKEAIFSFAKSKDGDATRGRQLLENLFSNLKPTEINGIVFALFAFIKKFPLNVELVLNLRALPVFNQDTRNKLDEIRLPLYDKQSLLKQFRSKPARIKLEKTDKFTLLGLGEIFNLIRQEELHAFPAEYGTRLESGNRDANQLIHHTTIRNISTDSADALQRQIFAGQESGQYVLTCARYKDKKPMAEYLCSALNQELQNAQTITQSLSVDDKIKFIVTLIQKCLRIRFFDKNNYYPFAFLLLNLLFLREKIGFCALTDVKIFMFGELSEVLLQVHQQLVVIPEDKIAEFSQNLFEFFGDFEFARAYDIQGDNGNLEDKNQESTHAENSQLIFQSAATLPGSRIQSESKSADARRLRFTLVNYHAHAESRINKWLEYAHRHSGFTEILPRQIMPTTPVENRYITIEPRNWIPNGVINYDQTWEFRIAVDPKPENLRKMVRALELIFDQEEYSDIQVKCFVMNNKNEQQLIELGLDGTQTNLGMPSDQDQRGAEVKIFIKYDSRMKKAQLGGNELKKLLLNCWAALCNAGVVGIGYMPALTDAKPIHSQGGFSTPFSYTLVTPENNIRHGVLYKIDYKPKYFLDPFVDIVISYDDLCRHKITQKQAYDILKMQFDYLHKHQTDSGVAINLQLAQVKEKYFVPHEDIDRISSPSHSSNVSSTARSTLEFKRGDVTKHKLKKTSDPLASPVIVQSDEIIDLGRAIEDFRNYLNDQSQRGDKLLHLLNTEIAEKIDRILEYLPRNEDSTLSLIDVAKRLDAQKLQPKLKELIAILDEIISIKDKIDQSLESIYTDLIGLHLKIMYPVDDAEFEYQQKKWIDSRPTHQFLFIFSPRSKCWNIIAFVRIERHSEEYRIISLQADSDIVKELQKIDISNYAAWNKKELIALLKNPIPEIGSLLEDTYFSKTYNIDKSMLKQMVKAHPGKMQLVYREIIHWQRENIIISHLAANEILARYNMKLFMQIITDKNYAKTQAAIKAAPKGWQLMVSACEKIVDDPYRCFGECQQIASKRLELKPGLFARKPMPTKSYDMFSIIKRPEDLRASIDFIALVADYYTHLRDSELPEDQTKYGVLQQDKHIKEMLSDNEDDSYNVFQKLSSLVPAHGSGSIN